MYVYIYIYISCAEVYELPQSHCGDSREGTLFHDYINIHT